MKLLLVHSFANGSKIYLKEDKIVSFTEPADRSGTYISTGEYSHHVRESIQTLLKKPKKKARRK